MSLLDIKHEVKNKFAKSNPRFLESMFGSTEVTPLWIADMDFKVAEPITKELARLVERGIYSYEFIEKDVFKAIKDWNFRRNQLDLNTKAFLQVPGVLTGISLLVRELSKEGEGVVVQTPVYHQFFKVIKSAKREVVENPLKIIEGKYTIDFEDLELKFKNENVKLMILCNPHNPVGRVWTKEEMTKLIELANQYDVTIISDEIHSDIIFSPSKFTSIVSLDTLNKHVAVIGSPAKTFGMHSISNGYLYISNEEIHKQLKDVITGMYLDHGNALSAYATIAAYTQGEDWLNELLAYLQKTNNWIEDFVEKELPEVKLFKPEGTYQIWLDFSSLNLSEDALNHLVVDKANLALTPGNWFGDNHSSFMRLNTASTLSTIQEAFTKLKEAIKCGVDVKGLDNKSQGSCCSC
ncbi:MalY/PatB family protein [Flammeovirga kamogawensis]|uniref:cysteine-S-conjugate beta-lyase n=1 Tax=Flammeovirga kamogawensis TaxID=373891 RepID=A0ABX8GUQ8_9BACT|nr:PatB family C-S lyase [Flammeovirga kamogawensis]MBB6459889.1 cystathionine beta-lyase [Flammeovirga kamogawensis]QWG07058.1 PatB family C-S lyase [Flammeovirga kamogawensis]TRX68879.1 putative C-S lyase [Flammeovirga kamogawensis]